MLLCFHPFLHSTSVLSVCTLAIFLDYSEVGKYQSCAKDLSSKSFYIKKKIKDIKLVGTFVVSLSITRS